MNYKIVILLVDILYFLLFIGGICLHNYSVKHHEHEIMIASVYLIKFSFIIMVSICAVLGLLNLYS